VTITDPPDFETSLDVRGHVMHGQHRVLIVESSSVPNALAALALHVRDTTGVIPYLYFEWTEDNPVANRCASCCSGSARSRLSPARSCVVRNLTDHADPISTWGERRTMGA
jgi:hypothetical protein